MPRYVILEHDWNGVHYDLMLEHGGALVTWRLEELPCAGCQRVIKLPDHRTWYLQYEGEVSGQRGRVRRIAEGEYTSTQISDSCWVVELSGHYQGIATIRQETGQYWQFDWRLAH